MPFGKDAPFSHTYLLPPLSTFGKKAQTIHSHRFGFFVHRWQLLSLRFVEPDQSGGWRKDHILAGTGDRSIINAFFPASETLHRSPSPKEYLAKR